MAKAAAKRKVESILPPTKRRKQQQKMPPSEASSSRYTYATWSSESSDDELSVGTPRYVKKKQTTAGAAQGEGKRARKSEKLPSERVDEYAEDEGRIGSQQFLALVQFEDKKKKMAIKAAETFLEGYTKRLEGEERMLKERWEELRKEASENDAKFIERFKELFKISRPISTPINGENAGGDTGFATLYKRSRRLVKDAHGVLEEFERVARLATECEKEGLGSVEWAVEDEELMKVLDAGRVVGIEKLKGLMGAPHPGPVDGDTTRLAGIIYNGEDESLVGWGNIARQQGKATRRLMKTFELGVAGAV